MVVVRMLGRHGLVMLVVVALAAGCGAGGEAADGGDGSQTPGAGTQQDAAEPITITWESYNYGTQGLGGEGTQRLLDAFAEQHPDIRVEPVGTPAGEIHTSVQAKAAAGDPPEVAQIGWSKFAFAQENLPLVPVQEIAPPGEWEAHVAGFSEQALAIGEADGQIVAMPYAVSTPTLFYNADLLRQAGLDPDAPPETWDEVRSAALQLVERTDAEGVYLAAANAAKSDFITQSLINSNGGRLLAEDGTAAFDGPEAVEALAMTQDLTESGAQPRIADDEAVALFRAGRLGMYLTSTALLAGFQEAATDGDWELRTAGMPAFGAQPVRVTNSGGGLFVLTDDPEEQAAAWEFVRFLTSDEAFTILATTIGYLPLRPAAVDDPDQLGSYLEENPALLPAIAQLDELEPYQDMPGPDGARARELLQDEAVAPIMLDGADPTATLSAVADRVDELLAP